MTKLTYIYKANDGRKFNVNTYPEVRGLIARHGGSYTTKYTNISDVYGEPYRKSAPLPEKRKVILESEGVVR